jgi:hypothetical protein
LNQARKIKRLFQYRFDTRLAPRRLLVGAGRDNNDRRRRRKYFGIKFFKGLVIGISSLVIFSVIGHFPR